MSGGSEFVQLVGRICESHLAGQSPTEFAMGVVLSLEPMQIQIDNRFAVGEAHLILSALCREHKKRIAGGEVILWRGLAVGDKVRMICASGGQMYYVIDREGEYA